MNISHANLQSVSALKSGFADGTVIHNRIYPKPHRFKNHMCWCVFDLDEMDRWFKRSKLWKHNKWSVFSLYDRDYVNSEALPIKQKLIQYISQKTGENFNGRVCLFTHPRFLGYGFNSVNFYFCYQKNEVGEILRYIVSEINNTPWGEKHLYLHDCQQNNAVDTSLSFEFEKQFHISPFVPMQMNYRWDFQVSENEIKVKMWVKKQQQTILTVVLDTNITVLVENNLNSLLLKRPFQPWKMSFGIYWQAFKLWLKRVPVYDHPDNQSKNNNNDNNV